MTDAYRFMTVLAGRVACVVEDIAFPTARVMAILAGALVVIRRFHGLMTIRTGVGANLMVEAGDTP